jgi:spiro-SPASM protein
VNPDVLIYMESASGDEELTFSGSFLPDVLAKALGTLNNVGRIFYSAPSTYSGRLISNKNFIPRTGHDDVEFWKDIFTRTGSDHICTIDTESPFLDASLIREMIDQHLTYLAEFTFSENLPPGLSAEVISKELIASIPDFPDKTLPLSRVIRTNINQFDVELFYKEPDIRDKRLSFLSSDARDKKIMENISSLHGKIPSYFEIKGIIENNTEVLYIGPSYLEVELTGSCELDCLYCYRNTLAKPHPDIDAGLLKNIFKQMRSFDLPYTVCYSGSGEPMMHPKFYEILALTNDEPLVESIIVETSGLQADGNYLNFVLNQGSKIKTIVNISGMNSETYLKLHGRDRFEQVHKNILSLNEACNDRLFIQIMKINETEPFLDAYYDFWEKQKLAIILQKQNTYLGRVQDRRYSDLTPLDRVPCWHLQRDLFILSDGRVSFCKQDVDGDWSCGSAAAETIPKIWEMKKESFIKDYKKNYATTPDCRSCDEWYTFNF